VKNRPLYLLLLVVLFLALGLSRAYAGQAPDIMINTDGQSLHLSDLRGEVIYLDFWASWCVPCRESFPWMNEMEKKYADKGFKVIAINLDEDKSLADAFLTRYSASFKVGFDASGRSAELFRVQGMPSSYLIDRQGNVVSSHIGFRQKDMQQLEAGIKSLITR